MGFHSSSRDNHETADEAEALIDRIPRIFDYPYFHCTRTPSQHIILIRADVRKQMCVSPPPRQLRTSRNTLGERRRRSVAHAAPSTPVAIELSKRLDISSCVSTTEMLLPSERRRNYTHSASDTHQQAYTYDMALPAIAPFPPFTDFLRHRALLAESST